jgi:outer membrane biosynthesis protein TonB
VVYVPAHAAAPTPPADKPQVMVIEEPAPPPVPEETAPPQTPEPTAPRRPRRPAHPETPAEPDETPAPENPETPPAEVPALEPRQSSAQETELRRQYLSLEQDVRSRLARLHGAHLSSNDQKTLEDARTFFVQAMQAMSIGDLPRALNLARKAGLLLAALE